MWRGEDGADPSLLQDIPLNEPLLAKLQSSGVAFVDKTAKSSQLAYVLVGVEGSNAVAVSESLAIALEASPPRPQVQSEPFSRGVELSWAPTPGLGAVIFRRDLIQGERQPKRIAELDASALNVFVDHDVQSGGAYAYRVALARDYDGVFRHYGPPSDEIYVTVPSEAP